MLIGVICFSFASGSLASILQTMDVTDVEVREMYIQKREDDGWLYLDFLIEGNTK